MQYSQDNVMRAETNIVVQFLQRRNSLFSQLWAKPMPPWASPAQWPLCAPLKAARKVSGPGLQQGQGQVQQPAGGLGRQLPPGASPFLERRVASPLRSLSEAPTETRRWRWGLASTDTRAGAARTAPTSTPMTRAPAFAGWLRWRGSTWTCARMKGRGSPTFTSSYWHCY